MKIIVIFCLLTIIACTAQHDDLPDYAQPDGVCGSILKTSFETNYHPVLIQNCSTCHSIGHGSSNSDIAYSAFSSYGEDLIYGNATSENHNPPFTGGHLVSELETARQDWVTASDSYIDCLRSQ